MNKRVTILCLIAALAAGAIANAMGSAAGKHYWKCYESGCGLAKWNGPYSSRDAANQAGKNHERTTKGHRWDLKED